MNLRTRILIGYGYLVTLLVISAAGAALGFHQLGSNIGVVLEENFESVRASMAMLEALERQDSALLARLLQDSAAAGLLAESESSFRAALARAQSNVTIANEREILNDIEERFTAYCAARDRLLGSPPERPLQAYDAETFPAFEAVKSRVFDLLDVNHQAMVEADRAAQRTATRRAALLGLLVTLAVLSMGLLSRGLARHLFARLDELKTVAQAIARGDHTRRAAVERTDELGLVAEQLNAALDRQQELRRTMEGRLGRQRQWLLGLLGAWAERAALVSLDGEIMASTLGSLDTAAVAEAAARLREEVRDAGSGPRDVTLEARDRNIGFRLLLADGTRPSAWLATLRAAAPGRPLPARPANDP